MRTVTLPPARRKIRPMFKIFRKGRGPRELTVDMVGIRMGERFVQFGPGDPAAFAALASKVGLTGRACVVVGDARAAERMEAAAAAEGVLVEVLTAAPAGGSGEAASPVSGLEGESFDVGVVDGNLIAELPPSEAASQLREAHRVLRGGARLVAVHRARRGAAALVGVERTEAGGIAPLLMTALQGGGFRPVRLLAAREGLTFLEGFRPATP